MTVEGDLEIPAGATLSLDTARLRVHGSVIVRGTLQLLNDSTLVIEKDGRSRSLNIWGGHVVAMNGSSTLGNNIMGADVIEIRDGSLTLQGGLVDGGRLMARNSAVQLANARVTLSGDTIGLYGGSAAIHLENARINFTDSQAYLTYYFDAASQGWFLNTSVDFFNLGGPGFKEVAYRLQVDVRNTAGQPIENASVQTLAVPLNQPDDEQRTDENGAVHLVQIVFDATTVVRPHDPHLVVVDGLPLMASLASRGDQTISITYPLD